MQTQPQCNPRYRLSVFEKGAVESGQLEFVNFRGALKVNPQTASSGSDQPTGLRASECDAPVAGHSGQGEPGVTFIRCPGRTPRTRDHHCLVRIRFIVVVSFVSAAFANFTGITQPKHRPDIRLLCRDLPGLAAIARGRGLSKRRGCRIEISTADDPVRRISESHAEYTCARRST